jgi:uncharacterized protein YuzE
MKTRIPVVISCGEKEATIWFAISKDAVRVKAIDEVGSAELLFQDTALKGLRFRQLSGLCPYELAKTIRAHAGANIEAELPASYDATCDMGYVYLEERGPASVAHTVCASNVNIDVGRDGAIVGLEVFSPSTTLPKLANSQHE